jgi:hypothetical protein
MKAVIKNLEKYNDIQKKEDMAGEPTERMDELES